MSVHEQNAKRPDITLNLRTVLNDLVADGRLTPDAADELSLKTRKKHQLRSS